MDNPTQRVLQERYRLEQVLGQGGMARTWLAVDTHRERQLLEGDTEPEDLDHDGILDASRVAIKELPLSRLREWKDLAMFEREAQMLGDLDHPGIPNSLDHFVLQEDGGPTFYLVQEWIDGQSLRELMQKGERFPEARIRELLWQLLPILRYLHSRTPPVIHRDIKPSNILLRRDGRVALIDFGAGREASGESGPVSSVVGTFGYMPPEQMRARATPTSDIYALGATCCALLCRREPGDMPVKGQPFLIDFRSFCQVSEPFAALLDDMLRPDLETRLGDAQAALRRLDKLDDVPALPGEAPRPAPPPEPGPLVAQQPRNLSLSQMTYSFWDLPSRWRYAGLLISLPFLLPPFTPLGILGLFCSVLVARKSLTEGQRNRELLRRGTLVRGEVTAKRYVASAHQLEYVYMVHRQTWRATLEVSRALADSLHPGDKIQVAVDPYQPEDSVPILGRARAGEA
jgi:serine/threonine protein kinase